MEYVVKFDGSGRLTTRNRRFLRTFLAASTEIECAPPSTMITNQTPKLSSPMQPVIPMTSPENAPVPQDTDESFRVDIDHPAMLNSDNTHPANSTHPQPHRVTASPIKGYQFPSKVI